MKRYCYPTQDTKRAALLESLVATMEKADATALAKAWLSTYSQRQEARRKPEAATALFRRQAAATDTAIRTATRQIKRFINLPTGVLPMRELVGSGDAAPACVADQPGQRQYYALYKNRDQPTGSQEATIRVVVANVPVAALAC